MSNLHHEPIVFTAGSGSSETWAPDLAAVQKRLHGDIDSSVEIGYRPPWHAGLTVSRELLNGWLEFYTRALHLKGQFGPRINFVRVESPGESASELTLAAVLFERWWPQLWDVYESLEMLASLPPGADPILRGVLNELQLDAVLQLLQSNGVSEIAPNSDELNGENEALMMQLEQMQAELDRQFSEAEELRSQLKQRDRLLADEENRTEALRRHADSLEQEIQALREVIESLSNEAGTGSDDLQSELEVTRFRLQQVQEELEQQFMLSRLLQEEGTSARDALKQARVLLLAQLTGQP